MVVKIKLLFEFAGCFFVFYIIFSISSFFIKNKINKNPQKVIIKYSLYASIIITLILNLNAFFRSFIYH